MSVRGVAGQQIAAGTQTAGGPVVVFSNSPTVTFGLSNNTVTASAAGGGGAGTLSIYGVGNTTGQSSSSSIAGTNFSFDGAGAISVGLSGGSVVISAPNTVALTQFSAGISTGGNTSNNSGVVTGQLVLAATNALTLSGSTNAGSMTITMSVPQTSSLIGASGLTVSTAGSTISVGNQAVTRFIWPQANVTPISAPGQGSASIQYFALDVPLTATRLDALFAWAASSSATTNTAAVVISAWAAIYTRNASTLSSLSSGSTQTTYTYASNTAGNTQLISSAVRPVSVPINMSFTQGEYFVGFNMSTNSSSIGASTTNLAQTISVMGGNQLQTANNYAEFTNQTATSTGLYGGMGVFTAQTAGLPVSIGLVNIAQTGASLSQANIALVFRNN